MTAPITPKDPTSTKLSDHRIGKGYSYLFAALLTALLASQSIAIEFSTDKSGDFKIAIASKEIIRLQYGGFGAMAAAMLLVFGIAICKDLPAALPLESLHPKEQLLGWRCEACK